MRNALFYWHSADLRHWQNYALRFVGDGAFRSTSFLSSNATVLLGIYKGTVKMLGWWAAFLSGPRYAWQMENAAVDRALSFLLGGKEAVAQGMSPSPGWLVSLVERAITPWIFHGN